jgi:hypothetical protein
MSDAKSPILGECDNAPKEVGASETRIVTPRGFPHASPGDEARGLPPEEDFAKVLEEPAVCDDAVPVRRQAREQGALDGACDGWGYCRKRPHRAMLRKTRETGCVRADMFRTEPEDVEDDQRLHGRKLSARAQVDMRPTLRSSAEPSLDQLSDGEGGCRLRQKGEPGQRRSIPYHAATCCR